MDERDTAVTKDLSKCCDIVRGPLLFVVDALIVNRMASLGNLC